MDEKMHVTPCRSLADVVIKLKAVLHPELGLFSAGLGAWHEAALQDIAGLLQRSTQADADLLALAPEFERRWAEERRVFERQDGAPFDENLDTAMCAEVEAALDHTGDVAHHIARMPARTLDGLRLQARAVVWAASDSGNLLNFELADKGTYADFIRLILGNLLGVAVDVPWPLKIPTPTAAEAAA